MVQIKIESAGDHHFDLDHFRQQGGEELLRRLLALAGITEGYWRAQVQKKLACVGHTPPITVRSAKRWCVYLRVKPGDNNSCHFVSLLVPDGIIGTQIVKNLDNASKRFTRNWKNEDQTEIMAQESSEEQTARSWLHDVNKLQELLSKIQNILESPVILNKRRFMELLRNKIGWVDAKISGSIVSALVRTDYLTNDAENQVHAYDLTQKALEMIAAKNSAPAKTEPEPKPEPEPEKKKSTSESGASVLFAFRELAPMFEDAVEKLVKNREEFELHVEEMNRLNREANEICNIVDDEEIRTCLQNLINACTKQLPKKEIAK